MPSSDLPPEDLEDLYENAPCGYLSLSPDAHIAKVNARLARWLEMPADELVGKPFHEILSFGGRIAFETHLAPILRMQQGVSEVALDLLRADGTRIPIIANAAEKRDSEGRPLFTRLALFKAIDRRSYERGLVAARNKAEDAAQVEHETAILREQFIAVLGHDLKNPLAALAAGVRLLQLRETLSDRGRLVVKEMAGSVARATALVENVLDFARGRLGEGLTLARKDEELTPILEQAVAEIATIAPDREIVTHFELSQPVNCDGGRMGQVVSNLLSNAVTHGAPGIPIEVEARTGEGRFTLSVTNGGLPIPEAALSQLFQPFFRGAVRRSRQGLGLGLFIVNEIAEAHGGTMDVVSTDEMTRFTLSMPLAPA